MSSPVAAFTDAQFAAVFAVVMVQLAFLGFGWLVLEALSRAVAIGVRFLFVKLGRPLRDPLCPVRSCEACDQLGWSCRGHEGLMHVGRLEAER